MPRDGAGHYSTLPGTLATPNTTIASSAYNANVADVAADLDAPRPVVSGGTGASTPDAGLTNLGAEKNNQVVTNFDTQPWVSGSFSSAISATNPPVASHRFAGIAYVADPNNMVVEARDLDDTSATKWVRQKNAGVWGAWAVDGAASTASVIGQCYLPTPTNPNFLTLVPKDGNKILLNGVMRVIPDAGVTVNAPGNLANTAYYIYAYWTGSAVALEFSTTAPATQTGTGIRIKTGDATRTLVGMCMAGTSNASWSLIPTECVSWFNPKPKTSNSGLFNPGTTSSSMVEMTSSGRVKFITFLEREVHFAIRGYLQQTVNTAAAQIDLYIAGTNPVFLWQTLFGGATAMIKSQPATAAGNWEFFEDEISVNLTPFGSGEAVSHYASGWFQTSTGTLILNGQATVVTIQG